MRREPRITPDAQADILAAARFYETEREGLGLEFLDEFDRTCALIQENPMAFTLVGDPVRRVLLRRFPYGVFYEPGDDCDTVLAVVDLRRDPETIRRAYHR
jgi:plasmid stabilization system protein ParE